MVTEPIPDFETEPVDRPLVDFRVDGMLYQARRPKGGALLDLADIQSETSPIRQAQAARQFIEDCLTQESRERLNARLYDPDDDFDFPNLTPILKFLSGQFTARPTTSPGASQPTPRRTGRASTGRARSGVSTPENSTLPVS